MIWFLLAFGSLPSYGYTFPTVPVTIRYRLSMGSNVILVFFAETDWHNGAYLNVVQIHDASPINSSDLEASSFLSYISSKYNSYLYKPARESSLITH
jgi:hypothetical protein